MWVYLAGEAKQGKVIKIGSSKAATMAARLKDIDRDMSVLGENYVLLAAMRGETRAEIFTQDYFRQYQLDRGSREEYFAAEPPLVEYALWLRAQYCVNVDPTATEEFIPAEDINYWLPKPERRIPPPPDDLDVLFSRHIQMGKGVLAGTAWDWVPDPLHSFQDYFTPPEIVALAEQAMGGIDLDPASHFIANKRLIEAGVHIGQYFTRSHDAFEHDWYGRIWLNPPYGDNLPWFQRLDHEMAAGRVTQLCMLSPMWTFNTLQAQPYMATAAAMVVLSPTPKFYNPGDPTKTGKNHPHAIVYWGDRRADFLVAFKDIGIPCRLGSSV
jgi:hypothetical protein